MRPTLRAIVLITLGLAGSYPLARGAEPASKSAVAGTTIEGCLVTVIQQVKVPAREAGVLDSLDVVEGAIVEPGQRLGRVDDERARMELAQAEYELAVARENSDNDVNIRFSKASHAVAKTDLEMAEKANEKTNGAITQMEIRQLRLTSDKASLQIEQAQRDLNAARLTSEARQGQVEMRKTDIKRRQFHAPFKGIVVELYRQPGEWLSPGDPVLRVLRIDRLRVEGFLNARQFGSDVTGRPVTVSTELPGGRRVELPGKIVFVSPEIEPVTGEFRIWAEVENEGLVLRPGMQSRMTVHAAEPQPRAAR